MMHKVIMFSGIDGSGKTAHAYKVAQNLKNKGYSVKYYWSRGIGKVFFSLPILVFCRALGITVVHNLKNGLQSSEYRFYAYKPIRFIWILAQLIDMLLYKIAYLLSTNRFSGLIIMDRNAIDSLVDILADTHTKQALLVERLSLSLLPKKSIILLLDIPASIAIQRKSDIYDLNYLQERRALYLQMARKYGWSTVCTQTHFVVIEQQIADVLVNSGFC